MSEITNIENVKCKKVKPQKIAPETVKKLWAVGVFILGASILAQFLFEMPTKHHFSWEEIPFFFVVYGFLACAAIIVVSKLLGFLLKRPLDYYEDK